MNSTLPSGFGRHLAAWAALVMATLVLAGSARAAGEGETARAVLEKYCYRCHGQDGRSEGGLNVVTDLAKLVQSKRVIPGDPEGSALLRRVVAEDMPPEFDSDDATEPPRALPRPTAAEVAALRDWIEAGAATPSPAAARAFIDEMQVLRLVEDDLKGLPTRTRRWTRYFSLVHRANVGDNDDQLQSYRHGLAKLLNSLSWGRRIVVPRPIDPAGTLLRIDLRDYLWDEATWEVIQGANPYAALPGGAVGESVAELSACALPIARADWFVYEASRPPLYHEILRLPETVGELERKLDVDAAANIRMDLVARAGFGDSGVSRNNRLIERHESAHGAYWKSYDFAGNADRRNLFANPLGPGDGPHAFEHDGGEIIFALPNGLNGYMLADGLGHRIDKGPTAVVRDPKQADSAVVNGISCMSCHGRGFIAKQDRVRELVAANRAFGSEVIEEVEALYPGRDRLEEHFRDDSARFAEAVKATGASLSRTEPVFALAGQFEEDIDLTLAAAESGLPAEEFRRLLTRWPELAQALGPLLAGGLVKRDAFADTFPRIVEAMGLTLGGPGAIGGHQASRSGVGRATPSRSGSRPGLVAEYFEGDKFQNRLAWRIDPNVDFRWGDASPDPAVPRDFFGARWTGTLRPPKAGRYVLRIRSDNGARWILGGRVLYDDLTVHGEHDREIEVDLEAAPQAMQLDYLEGVFTAWCQLSWRPPGRSEFEPIPADCLAHNADQEPEAGPRPRAGHVVKPPVDLTPQGGFLVGDGYRDLAPSGGVLIGFRYTTKSLAGAHRIMGFLQPIYLTRGGEQAGGAYGDPTGQVSVVKARPGYAIGAIRVRGGGLWEGMGVVFMRIKGQRLDPSDAYESPWIGRENASGPITTVPDGRMVVGIHGKLVRGSHEICTIGLVASGNESGGD